MFNLSEHTDPHVLGCKNNLRKLEKVCNWIATQNLNTQFNEQEGKKKTKQST